MDLIKEKILKQSRHKSFLDILIAIKCYLTNNEENAWFVFDKKDDQAILLSNHNKNYQRYKEKNDLLLSLVHLKPIDVFLLAKNKKINLLLFIEDTIKDIITDEIIIIDLIRTNPYEKDHLFEYIKDQTFHKQIIEIYKNRNNDKDRIINLSKINAKYYKSCAYKSKELKISDYWKNIWGLGVSYNIEKSILDNLIL